VAASKSRRLSIISVSIRPVSGDSRVSGGQQLGPLAGLERTHHVEPFHGYGSSIVTLHRADLAIFVVPLITAALCLHRVAGQRLLNELRTKMLKNVLVNEKP